MKSSAYQSPSTPALCLAPGVANSGPWLLSAALGPRYHPDRGFHDIIFILCFEKPRQGVVKHISQSYQVAKKEPQAGTRAQRPHLPPKHHAASWDTGAAASCLCLLIGQTLTPLPPSLW